MAAWQRVIRLQQHTFLHLTCVHLASGRLAVRPDSLPSRTGSAVGGWQRCRSAACVPFFIMPAVWCSPNDATLSVCGNCVILPPKPAKRPVTQHRFRRASGHTATTVKSRVSHVPTINTVGSSPTSFWGTFFPWHPDVTQFPVAAADLQRQPRHPWARSALPASPSFPPVTQPPPACRSPPQVPHSPSLLCSGSTPLAGRQPTPHHPITAYPSARAGTAAAGSTADSSGGGWHGTGGCVRALRSRTLGGVRDCALRVCWCRQ